MSQVLTNVLKDRAAINRVRNSSHKAKHRAAADCGTNINGNAKAVGILLANGIIPCVGIEIRPPGQPDRILGEEDPSGAVILPSRGGQ